MYLYVLFAAQKLGVAWSIFLQSQHLEDYCGTGSKTAPSFPLVIAKGQFWASFQSVLNIFKNFVYLPTSLIQSTGALGVYLWFQLQAWLAQHAI